MTYEDKLEYTRQIVYPLMSQNLTKPWKFKLMSSYETAGITDIENHTIALSRPYIRVADKRSIRDTILHEIAHALVGAGHGHGPVWKRKAREIGAKPERCFVSEELPDGKYEAVCENCGPTGILRWRRSKNRLHNKCRGAIGWREVALATT